MKDYTYFSRMKPDEIGGRIAPTVKLISLLVEWQSYLDAIQSLEREKQSIYEQIAVIVRENESIGTLATWSPAAPIDRLRGAELRTSHPQIYERFVNRPPRRLLKVALPACERWLEMHGEEGVEA